MTVEGPSIWTIASDRPFADALVEGVLARYPVDPLDLSRLTLLLPSRRAIRAVRDAFLRTVGGRAMLMPAMRAVSDIDEEEAGILGAGLEGLPGSGDPANLLDLPPAIAPTRRHLELTRLVLLAEPDMEPAQAVQLGAELAKFLNQVQAEERRPQDLAKIDVGNLADHWGRVLKVLDIIIRLWPDALADKGLMDPAMRRNALMRGQADFWRAHPPGDPVIAAGITRSSPAVAALLSVVCRLPQGHVVMPGLDLILEDEAWTAIDDSHPQASMKKLLDNMRVTRRDCRPFDWAAATRDDRYQARAALLSMVMRPASTTIAWQDASLDIPAALDGVTRLDCDNPGEEARVIALLMRQQLEVPDKTVALISPDRMLARRVAVELQRWGIDVDDSAGRPLTQMPVGIFLRHVLLLIEEDWAPHALLALARLPLLGGPLDNAARLRLVDGLEKAVLRGPRPKSGLAGLKEAVDASKLYDKAAAHDWLDWLGQGVLPLADLLAQDKVALDDVINAHIECAELIALQPGKARNDLWRGDDGEAAVLFLGDLLDSADVLQTVAGRNYPGFLDAMMQQVTVRRKFGAHPRLFIWGNIEAQLQQADMLIIAGLNDGIWPPDPAGDPWMSRPMRRDFGLPLPESRIGEAAHDFVQALAAPSVVITRAEKADGVPTVPSRWLLRLDAVLGKPGRELLAAKAAAWPGGDPRAWARAMEGGDAPVTPQRPPEPKPPLALRPDTLAVTRIETWLQDPYAIYAQKILGLRKLDPVDADPGAAERGTFIHAALESFMQDDRFSAAADYASPLARQALMDYGRKAFGDLLTRPAIRAFWWPRFERLADWFLETQAGRADDWQTVVMEKTGQLILHIDDAPFTVEANADRIDRHRHTGAHDIIDYKTGTAPTTGKVKLGLSCQLQVEALMVARGGFDDLPLGPIANLWFWELRGALSAPGKESKAVGRDTDVDTLMAEAEQGLTDLIRAFRDPDQAYLAVPRDDAQPRFNDYEHLERVDEWILAGDAMGGGA